MTTPAVAAEPAPADAAASTQTRVYIVQLKEPAAIAAVPGRRQRTEAGKFDARAPAVSSYGAALVYSHDQLLAEVGAPAAKLYSYKLAFNGFAARLTPEQAARLRAHPAVSRVWEDRVKSLRAAAGRDFLGLTDAGTGLRTARALSGEGVVIGIIDSGITPEHPSFADRREKPKPRICRSEWGKNSLLGIWLCQPFKKTRYEFDYTPPAGWHGRCETGQAFTSEACNYKIVGARFYRQGFRQLYEADTGEFLSPRDADGHGTLMASIAAGGRVRAEIGGTVLTNIGGVAPRARIAVYKACWLEAGATRATCAMSDLQRAIEDAVADGVDIINYSVGTTDGGPADPDALALLAAADAGVLAVVAAGNGGPAAATVESPGSSPWVLTVAASSQTATRYDEVLQITSPASAAGDYNLKEAGFTPLLRDAGPVTGQVLPANDGEGAGAGDEGSADDACQPLHNAADLQGRIALVRRGLCNFQDKIANAEAAGALAVIVFNNDGVPITMTGQRGSVHIPAVMIGQADGEFLLARIAAGDLLQARLQKGRVAARDETGNVMYEASARGPDAILPDILKPDVTAPGVNILGAQTPDVANGVRHEHYQYLSGTSMAVPHVAGVAALLRQAHPDWSPAALRSALMTTARQDVVKEDGETPADPFDFGAGHIVPNLAADPGLVYDAEREDYDAFACGAGLPGPDADRCTALTEGGYPTEPDNLNLPTLTSSAVVHSRTLLRRVTNVGAAGRYEAVVDAPPGVGVTVTPPVLSLASGESADYTVTFTNLGDPARLDTWSFGALSWTGAGHVVRSPLVVAPAAIAVPDSVTGTEATGGVSFGVDFGYAGNYLAFTSGLARPTVYPGHVIDDPLNQYTIYADDSALPDYIRRVRVTVPAGVLYLRVAVAGADPGAADDFDLYLYCPDDQCPDGNTLLASATESGSEVIDLLYPPAGEYAIDVHGYDTDDLAGGPGANFDLGVWTVNDQPGPGNFAVTEAPATTSVGGSGEVSLGWENLDPGELYLGLVTHSDGERDLALTLVEIATPDAVAP